ncbi:glucosamine-6-phosphate deaminase [Prolixibacter bellariivorans]|uniref:Glucosamine-6-phosphate deaminase n=1 Tax=Prolixibacter bellariivorans TaxID=314319 RepID=A0A5M4AZ64_9BACT|nr:glucosamine-6-phosphate deaminase [Prolixibacter bellariivorans]GET33192.1 glucosamine-6-phosphate deaminase [Prolixibacter bellariivorans]
MDLSKKLQSDNPVFYGFGEYAPTNLTHRDMLTKYEKIPSYIYPEGKDVSQAVADEIADSIKKKQKKGEKCVLGLPTGSTQLGIYAELVRKHKEEGLSFNNVVTFNIDEYYPMSPHSIHSYNNYMHRHLYDHVDIPEENIHIPDGTIMFDSVHDYCREYERLIKEAGGIDLMLLGIGRTGHIGFNEPGSGRNTRTRIITLDPVTRQEEATEFQGFINVPRRAITMGVDTILESRKIILVALGESKARVIQKTVEEDPDSEVPASFIQEHHNVKVVLDSGASSQLVRVRTPWLVDNMDWNDDRLVRKAVVWLCKQAKKPLLKLTGKDYNDYGLSDLLATVGSAYRINIKVFNDLQHTITGWPGGKPEVDDSNRPERAEPAKKRIVIFSPHPDDDVISMGGTLLRLVEQGHDVHVAYQVSGNFAVADEYISRYLDFHHEYADFYDSGNKKAKEQNEKVLSFLKNKKDDEVDIPDVRKAKGLIRRMEARSALRYFGIPDSHIHFLDLPFYESGRRQKNPIGEEDVKIVMNLLDEVKPHQIFAAGDLSDPHGTHRVCLDTIFIALEHMREEKEWMKDCWLWLYRGAWAEWEADEIEMAVPISPIELARKRDAILRHQSQKEGAMFMGEDEREFWQRAEQRNRATARLYDELGMAEYEAMEAFVKYYP